MPASHCYVCGVPLTGVAGWLLAWRGVGRSSRNPNACTRCGAHLEEGRLVEMTVLFADLSGFTAMTGRLGETKTFAVVDEHLRAGSEILSRHGATIDKFIGDAVMAFFNAPIKREDHAAAAVAAARELHEMMPAVSQRIGVPLKVSIGIAAGFARVGRLGSDDPRDYTAIGSAVNQAARLQAQAKADEILVSDRVYEKVASAYPNVPPEHLVLKGFSEPAVAYRIKGVPAGPIQDEAWLKRRPAMGWGALAFALIGSGCLGKTVALTMTLAYGAGSASALSMFASSFEHSPWRTPVLAAAAGLSAIILVSLLKQRKQRKDCMAGNNCVEMTAAEKKAAAVAAALAIVPLVLVAIELFIHTFDVGMVWRTPLAQAISSHL